MTPVLNRYLCRSGIITLRQLVDITGLNLMDMGMQLKGMLIPLRTLWCHEGAICSLVNKEVLFI